MVEQMISQDTELEQNNDKTPRSKSNELNTKQRQQFNKYANQKKDNVSVFKTKQQLADDLGITRGTLRTLQRFWSCGPDTYQMLIDKKVIEPKEEDFSTAQA